MYTWHSVRKVHSSNLIRNTPTDLSEKSHEIGHTNDLDIANESHWLENFDNSNGSVHHNDSINASDPMIKVDIAHSDSKETLTSTTSDFACPPPLSQQSSNDDKNSKDLNPLIKEVPDDVEIDISEDDVVELCHKIADSTSHLSVAQLQALHHDISAVVASYSSRSKRRHLIDVCRFALGF